MMYDEALAEIHEGAEAECQTGLPDIDPLDHDAMLDRVVELAARITAVEKRQAQRLAAEECQP